MNQIFAATIPLVLVVVCLIIPVELLDWTRKRRRVNRRSPLTSKLLRGPGEMLRKEIENTLLDIGSYLAMLFAVPLLVFSVYLSQSHFGGVPDTVRRWSFIVFIIFVAVLYVFIKLNRLQRRRFELQTGLEAEIAMGQELDQLMRHGAVVFHDFPADGFNIDHVVLTRGGMYAVETKGRMKLERGGGTKDATVQFNGEVLSFPDWRDSKALEQAKRQAEWLAKWISSAVGESIGVKPVVALPGWWVDRTGRGVAWVISGGEAPALLKGWQRDAFSDQTMKRISHQLEQHCRDVEPTLYGKQEKFGRPVR